MLTPEQLQRMPQRLVQIMEDLEEDILRDICRRLKLSGTVTESALHQMRMLAEQGYSQKYIEQRIKESLDLGQAEIDAMFDEAVQRNEAFLKNAADKLDKQKITAPNRDWHSAIDRQVEAIRKQTHNEFRNITQSMGFAIKTTGTPQFLPAAKAYQRIMDRVTMEVATGATDYNTAIRRAVSDLAESGLQYIDYASGHRDHADVAARRALMTGVAQCAGRMSENTMELLGTRYVETEAHSGARDTGKGYLNHKSWQGRWFYWSQHGERDPLGKYPDFIETTGYGQGGGLCGWNCRHMWFPVIPGLDEPQYTKKRLEEIDPPPFGWKGKQYSAYAARQKQREYERRMRRYKRQLIAHDANGNEDDYNRYKEKLRKTSKEYKAFSNKAGLPLQMERARVQGFGHSEASKARKGLAKSSRSGILKDTTSADIPITEEAIQRVPLVRPEGWTVQQAEQLQEAHRELLRSVQDKPIGTEAGAVYTPEMNLIAKQSGATHEVSVPWFSEPHIFIHNHPSGLTFSAGDIENFGKRFDLEVMTAVGNNGVVYLLQKTETYDPVGLSKAFLIEQTKLQKIQTPNEYASEINHFLKEVDRYGARFIIGGKNLL